MMSTPRSYRSSLRVEQADETRRRIRQSARDLFIAQGFSNTTVVQIAKGAGVAPQTVYSVYQSKGGVVRAMLEDLEEVADQKGWEAKIRAEPHPPRQLELFVRWIRTLFELGAPVLRASIPAMADPNVSAFHAQGDANRLGAATALADHWAQAGALRRDLAPSAAAERLWLLTSSGQFLIAIDVLNWTPDAYERWLTEILQRELFAP
jgi:AcrR family transcriptional regulator